MLLRSCLDAWLAGSGDVKTARRHQTSSRANRGFRASDHQPSEHRCVTLSYSAASDIFSYTTTDVQHAQMPALHLQNCKYFDSDGTTRLNDSAIDSPRHIWPGLRGDGRSMTKVEATLRQRHDLQIIVNS